MRRVIFLLVLVAVILGVGCSPRGETASLDQILQTARDRYFDLSTQAGLKPEISGTLNQIDSALKSLETSDSTPTYSQVALQVADLLSSLDLHAGFTVRPSLGEIQSQYRALAGTKTLPQIGSTKLILARTYTILAEELAATGFKL